MAHDQADRKRTVCSDCDLAFYADAGGCPYCENARHSSDATVTETQQSPTGPADSVFLWRLKQAFGI